MPKLLHTTPNKLFGSNCSLLGLCQLGTDYNSGPGVCYQIHTVCRSGVVMLFPVNTAAHYVKEHCSYATRFLCPLVMQLYPRETDYLVYLETEMSKYKKKSCELTCKELLEIFFLCQSRINCGITIFLQFHCNSSQSVLVREICISSSHIAAKTRDAFLNPQWGEKSVSAMYL